MKFWSEMKGQVWCNTVYEDRYHQSRIKILYYMYIVLEKTNISIWLFEVRKGKKLFEIFPSWNCMKRKY